MFALSDCLSLTLPVEYSATTKGLRWLIPRQKLPWTKDHSEHGYSHSYQAVARHTRKSGDSTIKLHAGEEMEHSLDLHPTNFSKSLHQGLPLPVNIYPKSNRPVTHQNVTIKNTPYGLTLSSDEYYTYFLVSVAYICASRIFIFIFKTELIYSLLAARRTHVCEYCSQKIGEIHRVGLLHA